MKGSSAKPFIIAHRGGAAEGPENTLAAIKQALVLGVEGIEIDVMKSADGEVVVFHDADLQRLGGSPLVVEDTPAAELRQIDVGSHFSTAFRDERIPLLDEVLEVLKEHGEHIHLMIELKYLGSARKRPESLARRVADVVEAHGMMEKVSAMSLYHPGVKELIALCRPWRVGLVSADTITNPAAWEVDFYAMGKDVVSESFVQQAHAVKRPVHMWTVNEPGDIERLLEYGVDGLITDCPGIAKEVLTDPDA